MTQKILYEDNHLIIVDKPAGMLTQPSGTDRENLEDLIKEMIKVRDKKPGNVFLHAIFRLDHPVGGIVLFAKSRKALTRLQEYQKKKQYHKSYEAIVEGIPKKEEDTLEHYLVHDSYHAKVITKDTPGAKLARLHYRRIKTLNNNKSLLKVTLETGRYHQIRVQLAAIGHPIVGDKKYGATTTQQQDTIALKHVGLRFLHPVTKEEVSVSVKPAEGRAGSV